MVLRTWLVLLVVATALLGPAARGAEPSSAGSPPAADGAAPASATPGGGALAPSVTPPTPTPSPASPPAPAAVPPPPGAPEATDSAGVPMVAASAQAASPARYGVGARFRLTSVPKWALGLFLKESVPLNSYTTGAEFFRRSGNFDLVLGVAYQSLSPPDGNWLGKGQDASTETDYVQFRGLGAVSFDVAFIMHTDFNEYFGIHYGGGIGLAVTKGRLLRTSDGTAGCATAPGDTSQCYPVVCPQGPCTETQLANSEGRTDSPATPSRFSDGHVPTAYPLINLITGVDVRFPSVPGMALKLDLGYFFPYFFYGLSASYLL